MSGPILGGAGESGGASGWQLTGTRVELTLITNHVSIGTTTPALTGSGDLTVTGNTDLEGTISVGNALPVSSDVTLTLSRDFTSAAGPRMLRIDGEITTDVGVTNAMIFLQQGSYEIANSAAVSTMTGLYLVAPAITVNSGSVATASTQYIASAPTAATNNYALFIDSGDLRCDDQILVGSGGGSAPSIASTADVDTGINIENLTITFFRAGVQKAKLTSTFEINVPTNIKDTLDVEAHSIFGNGQGLDPDYTVLIDRNFILPDDGSGSQLRIFGSNITTVFGDTHPLVAALEVNVQVLSGTTVTVTDLTSVYIEGPPTFAGTTTNGPYALFIDDGDLRTDGSVFGGDANSYQLVNEVATSTNPTLCSNRTDLDTGAGWRAADEYALIAGGESALILVEANGEAYPVWRTTAGITATGGGGQGSAKLLGSRINEVSTVVTPGDSVKLVSAEAGIVMLIINNGANAMDIFPNTSDNLGAGVDTAVSLAAGSNITFSSYDATNWVSS